MMTEDLKLRFAYIAGPRDFKKYFEAGQYLMSLGFVPVNQFSLTADNEMICKRERRMEKVRNVELVFMLEGWKECPDAVDEYEEAVFYNKENERKIGISLPEFRA